MYGSIFRMKPKAGTKSAIFDHINRWHEGHGKNVPGYIANYALEADNGDLIGVAVFESEEAYRANASDPAQNDWYQELRKNLDVDPEWNDGAIRGWST
jgi:hypothetical protein